MNFLSDFGVQPILLAAQAVNFFILLFILKKFLYKPILKVLKERQDKIAKSMEQTEEIKQQLLKTEEDREKKLRAASLEAQQIIADAVASANQVIADAHKKAGENINVMTQKAEVALSLEKDRLQQQIKQELANLVTTSLEKILTKALTKDEQKKIIDRSIKDF